MFELELGDGIYKSVVKEYLEERKEKKRLKKQFIFLGIVVIVLYLITLFI